MLIGTIANILSAKGIGFIKPCGPGNDVFFHATVVAGDQFKQLKEGQAVAYELASDMKADERLRAAKVEPCDPKLLGACGEEEKPAKTHPRSRHRKPTWRR